MVTLYKIHSSAQPSYTKIRILHVITSDITKGRSQGGKLAERGPLATLGWTDS